MIDPHLVLDNLAEWIENPYWEDYYKNAPSDHCRDYIAMDFYASETEEDEAFEEMDRILHELDQKDIRYLFDHAKGPEKAVLANYIKPD